MPETSRGGVSVASVFTKYAPALSGRVPSAAWAEEIRRDPHLTRAVMVVDIMFGAGSGGQRIRVSARPLHSVSGRTGAQLPTVPAMLAEPDIDQTYSVGDGTSSGRGISISIRTSAVNPIRALRAGLYMGGTAEVSLELPDRRTKIANHDERLVIIRGSLSRVGFGAAALGVSRERAADPRLMRGSETIDLTIEDPRLVAQTRLPPWIIDTDGERFASPFYTALGARLPLVVNGYDKIPAVRVTDTETGANSFVFAYGHGWDVTDEGVYVNGISVDPTDPVYAWNRTEATDGVGVPYTKIDFTEGTTTWAESDVVHVSTTHSTDQDGLLGSIRAILEGFTPIGSRGINERLFGESASRMPTTGTPIALDIDWLSSASAFQPPQILINASGGGSAGGALDCIEQGILDSFPMVSMAWEDGGYGPIVTDWRLAADAPVARLKVGQVPLLDRASSVQVVVDDVRNSFVYRYNYDLLTSTYRGVIIRDSSNSGICQRSEALMEQRLDADPIESPYVKDPKTAEYVVDWMISHLAFPSLLVEYVATRSAFLTLRRGDPVQITDPRFDFEDEPATIDGVRLAGGQCTVSVRVRIEPGRWGGSAISVGGAAAPVGG